VRIPEEERRDFYLYADEFQNFASGSFASILSEARKYRLNLHLLIDVAQRAQLFPGLLIHLHTRLWWPRHSLP